MLLALGLVPGMGIPRERDDGSVLTNMRAQNNNRRRLPSKAARAQGNRQQRPGADDLCRFIGECFHASSCRPRGRTSNRLFLRCLGPRPARSRLRVGARAALARPRRLRPVGRCARRPAARTAGERGPGRAAHGGRQRGVQRPARGFRLCRAAAARLRHDRAHPLHRRRRRAEGPAAVHDRPAAVRGRGGAGAVAARRDQGPRRPGAERARARQDLARFAGDLAPGVRPADVGHAHLAGRHPGRRGARCARRGSISNTPRSGRRSPGAPRAPTSPSATS